MSARPVYQATPRCDLERLHMAARLAHGWDPADPPHEPLRKRDTAALLIGILVALVFLSLFLATGSYPA